MIGFQHFDESARLALTRGTQMARGRSPHVTSRHILAACIEDEAVIALLGDVGISAGKLRERIVPPQQDVPALLQSIGLDVDEIRRRLPRAGHSTPTLRLRRSLNRPLRVSMEGTGGSIRFAESGRKVLEVAVWNARRHGRVVSPLDLIRGVISDGGDPVNAEISAVARSGTFWPLTHELARLDAISL